MALAALVQDVQLASSDPVQALPWLVSIAQHATHRKAIGTVCGAGALATGLLLPESLSQQRNARRPGFALIVGSDHRKLASILLMYLITVLTLAFSGCTINMIIDRILYSSEAEATIEDRPAVLLITLTEAGVLMQLRQDLVQRWDRMIALQMF